jgi:hypothetical protein
MAQVVPLSCRHAFSELQTDFAPVVSVAQEWRERVALSFAELGLTETSLSSLRVDLKNNNIAYFNRRTPAEALAEKLITDVAIDMGMPVAPVVLAQDSNGTLIGTFSLKPFSHSYNVQQLSANEPDGYFTAYLRENPKLIFSAATLAGLDVWSGNSDRHSENIIVGMSEEFESKVDHDPMASKLYGIDHGEALQFDKPLRHEQQQMLRELPAAALLPGLRAACDAIRSYPTKQLYEHAKRLQPYCPQDGSFDIFSLTQRLAHRRPLVPSLLGAYKAAFSLLNVKISSGGPPKP